MERTILRIIKDFINQFPENILKNVAQDKAWADPLARFSSEAEPLHVGGFLTGKGIGWL